MTTPARYPTWAEIEDRCPGLVTKTAAEAIIKAAIDIERERVAKEAGEPVVWQYRGNDWKSQEWLTCVERVFNDVRNLPAYETRALVVQNSAEDIYAAYKTWPDDIRKKLSLHDLRRMNGWGKNSAVKVPDDVMADARSLIRMADTGMQCDAARGVLSFLETINQSAEKSE